MAQHITKAETSRIARAVDDLMPLVLGMHITEPRTISSYYTCCVCHQTHGPRMVMTHFDTFRNELTGAIEWRVSGFACLNHEGTRS